MSVSSDAAGPTGRCVTEKQSGVETDQETRTKLRSPEIDELEGGMGRGDFRSLDAR